jgi:hypothetical protein
MRKFLRILCNLCRRRHSTRHIAFFLFPQAIKSGNGSRAMWLTTTRQEDDKNAAL